MRRNTLRKASHWIRGACGLIEGRKGLTGGQSQDHPVKHEEEIGVVRRVRRVVLLFL